jgi:hypothetical protein
MTEERRIPRREAFPEPTFDAKWKPVTCGKCGRSFTCCPTDDYYATKDYPCTSAQDGVCHGCLMEIAKLLPAPTT